MFFLQSLKMIVNGILILSVKQMNGTSFAFCAAIH